MSLQTTSGLWWKAVDLRERLTDKGPFTAEVARQILRPDGAFTDDFDDLIQRAGYLLVLYRCEMKPPWDDPLTVAGVVTSVIDRLTDTFFAVVLPRAGAPGSVGAHLLEPAGRMLAAVEGRRPRPGASHVPVQRPLTGAAWTVVTGDHAGRAAGVTPVPAGVSPAPGSGPSPSAGRRRASWRRRPRR